MAIGSPASLENPLAVEVLAGRYGGAGRGRNAALPQGESGRAALRAAVFVRENRGQ